MRKFAPACALAAIALSCASVLAPAASASPAAAPARARLSHLQPGGPIALRGASASRGASFRNTHDVISDNWGGYAAARPGTRFRYIQATFFVPYVNCAATPNTFSAHWVGLDGLGDSTVEQDGILAACRGKSPQYSAWYEMFPQAPVYKQISIRPGDSIAASVYYSAGTKRFTLALTDTTTGARFRVTHGCPAGAVCRRASAEVISEAPASGTTILPLTDFSAESYSSIAITDRTGQRGRLRAATWDTFSITTEDSGGHVVDQPTQLYRGRAFAMYWMRQG